MKYFNILSILLLSTIVSFYSCKNNADASKDEAGAATEVTTTPITSDGVMPTPGAEPAQNAEGVWHFTCGKGCAGGAGAAGNCAVCGGPLTHNQAYHNNGNVSPAPTPISPSGTPTLNPATGAVPTPPIEPAQNAAGVWHFTCGKGCAGGAGAAGNCAKCGGPLAHNQAYHQ